ncbi:MAG: flagellar hook assembly protein FlgD [Bacillota bacterium]|nr:flagellar hook assembly protein FlgD [Bacillota bacterium]NLU54542.1 flagellar hook assembly protein FlgD [Bacillota bacterium]HOA91099.1 flagellar hook assembly protein FlgD [Bacillota bacterium]HOJ46330.1 flagellar hook assembly protein FlgD [Bacillota bacterium]HOL13939.1 flagellar hook assembly protein FlgD [Bacillota bacterium]
MRIESQSSISLQKSETDRNILGKDDFLKLLITQLRYQDPTNPVDDKEFIAQMAQFSSLEQMQNLNKLVQEYVGTQQAMTMFAQATNLIGLQVKVDKGDGTVDEGTVEAVRFSTAGPVIMVNGKDYLITDLIEISK